jgi:hypothetical protein
VEILICNIMKGADLPDLMLFRRPIVRICSVYAMSTVSYVVGVSFILEGIQRATKYSVWIDL